MKFLLKPNKKVYFASDLHLTPDKESRLREKKFIQWLDAIKYDAGIIFLLGDIFDFWFEYRDVVPRGFTRLLGKLDELTDAGITIYYFTGNHDLWMRDYLSDEIGLTVFRRPAEFTINDKTFLIGHGHYLGPVGIGQKILWYIFNNRLLKILYACLHPRWGMAIGRNWSKSSRAHHGLYEPFDGVDKEYIAVYAQEQLSQKHYDFFIFGHRHLAMDIQLAENSRYINTGEWVESCSYAVFDGEDVSLHSF